MYIRLGSSIHLKWSKNPTVSVFILHVLLKVVKCAGIFCVVSFWLAVAGNVPIIRGSVNPRVR